MKEVSLELLIFFILFCRMERAIYIKHFTITLGVLFFPNFLTIKSFWNCGTICKWITYFLHLWTWSKNNGGGVILNCMSLTNSWKPWGASQRPLLRCLLMPMSRSVNFLDRGSSLLSIDNHDYTHRWRSRPCQLKNRWTVIYMRFLAFVSRSCKNLIEMTEKQV